MNALRPPYIEKSLSLRDNSFHRTIHHYFQHSYAVSSFTHPILRQGSVAIRMFNKYTTRRGHLRLITEATELLSWIEMSIVIISDETVHAS
jgi:hypothetical protein